MQVQLPQNYAVMSHYYPVWHTNQINGQFCPKIHLQVNSILEKKQGKLFMIHDQILLQVIIQFTKKIYRYYKDHCHKHKLP